MKRLTLLIGCLILLAMSASAQYATSYQLGVTDLTGYATSGTNVWYKLAGTQTCDQIAAAFDGKVWCLKNHQVYTFNVAAQTWSLQSAMGTASQSLAVQDANNVWSLQSATWCAGYGHGYGVFKWNGTAWAGANGCLETVSVGADGMVVGVNYLGQLWESTNNWNWTQIGTSTGWTYAAIADATTICAVKNGQLYQLVSGSMALMSPQPSGTISGCAISQNDPVFMAWNTAGTLSLLNITTGIWQVVSGPAMSGIVSSVKSATFGLDTTGHPYHWNVYAAYIGGQTTGRWLNGCPNPGTQCLPGVTHTATLQTKFPHGIAGAMGTDTKCPTCEVNATSWDASPSCDLLFGDASSVECRPVPAGQTTCNQSHSVLATPTQIPPGEYFSEDYFEWDQTEVLGPTTGPAAGLYATHYHCGVDHGSFGFSTCMAGTQAVCQTLSRSGWYVASTPGRSAQGAEERCHKDPWSSIAVYPPGSTGSCTLLEVFEHAPIPGFCF